VQRQKYDLVKEMIAKRARRDLDKTHLNPNARILGYTTTKGGAGVDSISAFILPC
jgi:hypothetical protein